MRRVWAAVLVVGAVLPLPAVGQGEGGGEVRLHLAGIPAWTGIGSELGLDLDIDGAAESLEVVVTVRQRLESRSAFERTLDGESLGAAVGSVTVATGDLSAGPVGTHRVRVNVGDPPPPPPDPAGDQAGTPPTSPPALPSLPVTEEGVYPLVVELRTPGSGGPSAPSERETEDAGGRLVTYLAVLDPAQKHARTSVAWVWPLAVDAPRRPDGSVSSGLANAVLPSGRLARITAALAAVPDVPVTLAPRPAALDAWAELAATAPPRADSAPAAGDPAVAAAESLDVLRSQVAAAGRQVLTGMYARVNLPTLAAAGLDEEITAQLAEGADALAATLGIRPDARTFLAGNAVDEKALAVLRRAGVDRLVVGRDALVPVFEQLTPARPFGIESGGRTFLSASADPALGEILAEPSPQGTRAKPQENGGGTGTHSDAEVAQRLLAGLTLVALEAPSEERGVVVVPPGNWEPPTALLTSALSGLADHPVLDPVTLDGFFAHVTPAKGEAGSRVLGRPRRGRLALSATAIESARARIASLATMLPEGAAQPVTAGRRLLIAETEPFQERRADPEAKDYLAGVDGIITSVLAAVRLPEEPSVTLTAQRGRVPITLVNDFGTALAVRVRFSSDKLLFPDGDRHHVLLPPRSTTERFTVEARTSGSFPMEVEVTSPDGLLLVGRFEMTIRGTTVSGVALTITVAAGVFLMGWWGNHVRKSRRARR